MKRIKMFQAMTLRAVSLVPFVLLVAAVLLLTPGDTQADLSGQFRIIVNPSVDITELDLDDLKRIYLGKKTLWDSGSRIQPSLLNEKSSVTKEFLESSLRKTVRQYRAYWKRRLFSGGGAAPKTFRSSTQVVDFVASTEGGIGVVEGTIDDARVKVLSIKE
jgi:ABC-type phosphate transport system substrate-binding protein